MTPSVNQVGVQGFNVYRKAWHMLGLIFPFAFYLDFFSFLDPWLGESSRIMGILVLIAGVILVITLDLLRFRYPAFNDFFFRYAGPLMKEGEKKRFNATLPYMLANLILFLFFNYELVVIGSIFLMIGDPAAAWVGSNYGRHRLKNGKSLEGIGGFFVASFIGALLFIVFHTFGMGNFDAFSLLSGDGSLRLYIIPWLLIGALLAGLGEFFSENRLMGIIDDNLIIPLTGAIGMTLIGLLIPGMSNSDFFFDLSTIMVGTN